MSSHIYFLSDNNSERFSQKFLELIKKGDTPVCLSHSLPEYQIEVFKKHYTDFGWIVNGVTEKESSAKSPYQDSYACLTSGTTSLPKLCFYNIDKAKENALAHGKSLNLSSSLKIIQTLPIYHSFGVMCYIWLPLVMDMKIEYNDSPLGLRTLKKKQDKNLYLAISPSQMRFMLKEKTTGEFGLSTVSVGGGLAHKNELLEFQEKVGCDVYVTYGLSEAGPRVTTGKVNEQYIENSIGKPFEGIDINITKDGNLAIKTPYLKLNIETDELENEYLLTRDQVEIAEDGQIIFLARKDDLINVGGVSVYPQDIEKLSREYNGVVDAIVLKKEHKLQGEVPVLFVEGNVEESELDNFLTDRLMHLQRPAEIFILDSFPRTSLGKVNREELKKEYL